MNVDLKLRKWLLLALNLHNLHSIIFEAYKENNLQYNTKLDFINLNMIPIYKNFMKWISVIVKDRLLLCGLWFIKNDVPEPSVSAEGTTHVS